MQRYKFPVQTEVAECGLACVSVSLDMLGSKIDMVTLRGRFPMSTRGISLKDISEICGSLDLVTRAIRCEIQDLKQLKCPAILHWGFSHFVVLKKFENNGTITIVDPAVGERQIKTEELSRSFTGVALEISPAKSFETRKEKSALSIWSLFTLKGEISNSLGKALLFSLFLQAYLIGSPFFLQLSIDEAALKSDLGLLTTLAIGFGLFAIFNAVAEGLRGLTLQYVGALLSWEMTTRLFHQMIRLPLVWFQRRRLADALSRFDSLEPIKNLIANGFVAAIFDGVLSVSLIIAMFIYSTKLAWITLAAVGVVVLIKILSIRPLIDLGMASLQASIAEKGKRIETIRSMQTIKLLGGESARETDWANKFGESVVTQQQSGRFQAWVKASNSLVEALGLVVVVYFGAESVINGAFSIGMLYAFLSYRQQFTSRLISLVEQFVAWKMLDMHSERLADIAIQHRETGIDSPPGAQNVFKGKIELKAIAFRYSQFEQFTLRGLDLCVLPGEFIAIIGPSGSGKSTLLKILTGLYQPTSGEVKFDDIPATALGPNSIRKNIGVVMQDDELFSGSIADNVCFFDERPNHEKIWGVLKLAAFDEDVKKMPMQINTLVGDLGSNLSGGQKQRLLLARALYRDPKILILDEATSNLDMKREGLIHESLELLSITRIVVTHRPQTIKNADRVFVLEGNKLKPLTRPSRSMNDAL